MKSTRTLIVIADGGKALFFRNDGPGKGLVHLEQLDFAEKTPRSHDLGDERPGRVYASTGTHRSAMQPRSDPHDQMETQFAHRVAVRTENVFAEHEAERLIIVAAPRALGEIRKMLPKSLAKFLSATLAKDLTKTPVNDLPKHLEDVLAL